MCEFVGCLRFVSGFDLGFDCYFCAWSFERFRDGLILYFIICCNICCLLVDLWNYLCCVDFSEGNMYAIWGVFEFALRDFIGSFRVCYQNFLHVDASAGFCLLIYRLHMMLVVGKIALQPGMILGGVMGWMLQLDLTVFQAGGLFLDYHVFAQIGGSIDYALWFLDAVLWVLVLYFMWYSMVFRD
eukprot:gene2624-1622_t